MMEKRASGRYDVKDTTSDQVYRGTPTGNANCVAAVDATKGIVLMYGSDYITTYYSASNGGQTETARTGSSYAYMKVKDDPFDYANPSSTIKKKTIYEDLTNAGNPAGLLSLLRNKALATLQRSGYMATEENTVLKTLKSVTPHSPMYAAPSRLYTKMDFVFTVSTQNASGQASLITLTETCDIFAELESLLGLGIQSTQNELWSVEKGTGTFVLQARRYGHGMGMSQRGAMYMAKLGYTYDQILGFYYEDCKRVKHSFTNKILSASSTDQEITVETPAELEKTENISY
jgi:SpoIID/LytB domain protein